MFARRKVDFAVHVRGPANLLRIHGPRNRKPPLLPEARRLQHETFERGLAVIAVGSEIAQIPPVGARLRAVLFRIDGAVESARHWRSVLVFDQPQNRSAGERKIQAVAPDQFRRDVFPAPLSELRKRHRRIDVVKRGRPLCDRSNPLTYLGAFGDKRANDHKVCPGYFVFEPGSQILEAVI